MSRTSGGPRVRRWLTAAVSAGALTATLVTVASADQSQRSVSSVGPASTAVGSATALLPAADSSCDPTRSLPASSSDSGAKVRAIKARGFLIAGVDQNSYRWGYRNPASGELEGFDIDLVRAVAKAILGDAGKVQFKAVPTAKRIEAIQTGQVDLIARTMTITCDRLKEISFSTVYFQAGQQVVVPKASGAKDVDTALNGKTVCTADKSTGLDELKRDKHGAANIRTTSEQLDCLVLMQLGQVDAMMTDNALGVGLAAQDPTVQLIGTPLTQEPYGIAMNKGDVDLVARVNRVLEDYRQGGWQASYAKWLEPFLGPSAGPPAAAYLP